MLVPIALLLAVTLLVAIARRRAEIIRLRLERRLVHVAPGSWDAFRRAPPVHRYSDWLRGI